MTLERNILAAYPSAQEVFANIPSPYDDLSQTPVGPDTLSVLPATVPSLFQPAQAEAPYTRWVMEVSYVWDEGIGAMPTSGPPSGTGGQNGIGEVPVPGDTGFKARQSVAIVRTSAPFGMLLVYWFARRTGAQPRVPTPLPNNANAVFKYHKIDVSSPVVLEDNTVVYSYQGVYVFYLKKPIWALDGLDAGSTPVHIIPPELNKVPKDLFQQYLIQAGSTVSQNIGLVGLTQP